MKVLLISHTCFSTYNNMGKTFCSLFSNFPKDELCQLYIYPSLPDVDVCNSYYRVTDKELLANIWRFGKPGGMIEPQNVEFSKSTVFERAEDAVIYQREGNSAPLIRLLRDALWKISRWYTPQLRKWIEQEKPTCIFLAPGYAKFIYDIALKISADYHLPIVTYICDDYYFLQKPQTLLGKLYLSLLQKKTDQLMARTCHLVTICREIEACYGQKFGVKATVIMTGSEMKKQLYKHQRTDETIFSYLGNLRNGRSGSLAEIGRELDRLNKTKCMSAVLNIYTSENDPQILQCFDGIHAVRMKGFVSGEEFVRVFANSDFLVHAEAFDKLNADLVKHSVSTKIADSLASGVPLIAYGPENIASMRHLLRNGCAYVAVSRETLGAVLERALCCPQGRVEILEKAVSTADEYHNQERNSMRLYEILQQI